MDIRTRRATSLCAVLVIVSAGLGVVAAQVPAGAAGPSVSITPIPSVANYGEFEDESMTLTGADPNGSLSFSYFSDAACTAFRGGGSSNVFGDGTYGGDGFQINDEFAGLGNWSMQAEYTGVESGASATSACVTFTVNAGGSVTGVTALPWSGMGPLNAEASVNDLDIGGVHTGAIDGFVTFGLFKNAACTTPVPGYAPEEALLDASDINNPFADTPTGFVPVAAGSYYWRATYEGNSVYASSQSSCTPALLNFVPIPTGSGTPGACGPVPSAPANVTTAPGNGSATVSWAPSATGCVAGYVITPFIGSVPVPELAKLIPGTGTTTVMKGLKNGQAYKFTVEGENGVAVGPASTLVGPITAGAPMAPTAVHIAKSGKGALKVTFTAPAANGAAITSYAATCTSKNHGVAKTKAGPRSPLTVAGLTAGSTYTCTVRATNQRGTGPASRPSAAAKA